MSVSDYEKNPERIGRKKAALRAWQERNREYVNAKAKVWYEANREAASARRKTDEYRTQQQKAARKRYTSRPEVRERRNRASKAWRAKNRGRQYGMTNAEYETMLIAQNHLCAICRDAFPPVGRVYVDHCHVTQQVRELLCLRCNVTLGQLDERPELLRAAADYLERHHARLKRS